MDKNNTSDQPKEAHALEENPVAAPITTPTAKSRTKSRNITINRTMLIACGATAVVALLIGMSLGIVIGRNDHVNNTRSSAMRMGPGGSMNGMGGLQQNGFGRSGGYSRSQQSNRLTGVVTAVNGSTLTVAGNGTTYTVTTDSNTQWVGSNSAAVNDTVIISFSGSGSNLTALTVRVIGTSTDSTSQPTGNNT